MLLIGNRCPNCKRKLIVSRFDTTFRNPTTREERIAFGIPAGFCEDCNQLYVDQELLQLLDLEDSRCVFAIESDEIRRQEMLDQVENLLNRLFPN